MMDRKGSTQIKTFSPVQKPFIARKSIAPPKQEQQNIVKLERSILCFDPESRQTYTINLVTNEVRLELDAPQPYRDKAEADLVNIQKVIQLPSSEWDLNGDQAWRYRRRQLSDYLLHKMINPEPTYLAQSPMSDAFSNVTSLKFLVNISEYIKIEDSGPEKYYDQLNPLELELQIDLVTCADELIKIILREIYSIFNVKLKPKSSDHKFILQISGFREYLSGNYPILSYDRVRVSLRGIQYLQVVLTEVPKRNELLESFPPIFERSITYQIQKGVRTVLKVSEVPWDKFAQVPTLFFYPPYPLPHYKHQQRQSVSMFSSPHLQLTPAMPSVSSISSYVVENTLEQQMARNKQNYQPLRPRVLLKEKVAEFNQQRLQMLDQGLFNLDEHTLYSGECDWPFKIRLVGITNVYRLLVLDDKENDELKANPKRRATYNGLCPIRVITKESAKQEEQHNTSKKKKKVEVAGKKEIFPKFCNGAGDGSSILQRGVYTHICHGSQGQAALAAVAQRYELDHQPYLISVELMLYYGQGLLHQFTRSTSTKKPWSKMPRWDEYISFSGLKISQLPMEVRLCANIKMYSCNGDEQIIGCVMHDIFDDNGMFRQGRLEINIWPFYQVDQRIATMSNYRGVPIRGNTDPGYYAKLIVAFDQFDCNLLWSLRDHQVMQKLGFFRNVKNKEQLNTIKSKSNHQEKDQKSSQHAPAQRQAKATLYQKEPDWKETPTNAEIAQLSRLLKCDPINRVHYTEQDKHILLKCRAYYSSLGKNFPVYLYSVDWTDPEQIMETYRLLKTWEPLNSNEALPLLDAMISDEAIRKYSAQRVGKYKDDELVLFMLELTQALMFDQQHFSMLGEMLLERAIMNPWVVGHELFWQLRSQLHIQPSYERYALLLEQYMMICGWYRQELLDEVLVNDEVMVVGEAIKLETEKETRLKVLQDSLRNTRTKFGKQFKFAIDPRMACGDFILKSCFTLSSKKVPMFLVMALSESKGQGTQNSDIIVVKSNQISNTKNLLEQKQRNKDIKPNENCKIIFKCGDDLRQDLLTLQLIRIMDKIWLDYGLDYRMKPYGVVSTLDQVGMIQVVLHAETVGKIHLKSAGAVGALNKDSIMKYIKEFNANNMEKAQENFLRSCAGYCVATYLLGIGDRHSDNIMVTEMGHFFHIDFGHFLGNFKTKFGFKRERTPFAFTEEMAFVMGGQGKPLYKKFEEFCFQAYNQLRKHGHFLINIFMMMLSAGMPELQDIEDIEYLRDQLSLELSDQEATEKFRNEISNSLNDSWRRFDNLIHGIKHG